MNTVSKLMIAVASLAAPMIASADTVTETFTGTITGGASVDVQGFFGAPLTNLLGDAYTATYVIEGPPCGGSANCGGANGFTVVGDTTSFTLTIDGQAFSPPGQFGGSAVFQNSGSSSSVSLSAMGQTKDSDYPVTMMYQVTSGNFPALTMGVPFAFNYTVNPATDSASGEINAQLLDGGFDATLGISSINVSYVPVPLPAAVWMLLGALGGLGAFTRRHRPSMCAGA